MITIRAFLSGLWVTVAAISFLSVATAPQGRVLFAQPTDTPGTGTRNIQVVGRVAASQLMDHGRKEFLPDVEIEEDARRPLLYVAGVRGITVVDVADEERPEVLQLYRFGGDGISRNPKLARIGSRHFLVVGLEKESSSPGFAAAVLDVTRVPEGSQPKQIAAIADPTDRGFNALFAYRHSSGRALLFATGGEDIHVYDLGAVVGGRDGHLAAIGTPDQLDPTSTGFDDMYVGFEPESQQDRMYASGAGGYYVFDVTDPSNPEILAQVRSAAVQRGRKAVATPDGQFLVTSAGYRLSPIRIFDLQPAYAGLVDAVRTAVGAWTADWRHYAENFEVRWPYLFVAALYDGLQVVNIREAAEPYTVGYYRTAERSSAPIADRSADRQGAWAVDVRNSDGLIAVADRNTGLWLFRLDAFENWDGRGWGIPNSSSAQDWENGPDGVYRPPEP